MEIVEKLKIKLKNKEMEDHIKIADKIVLITGANRGIGLALVEEALKRGAKQVFI